MKPFHRILANSLVANLTTSFLWFAVTYWAYLETRSVLATSIIGGSFMLLSAISGLFFGTVVDRNRKKQVMLLASLGSLVAFGLGMVLLALSPPGSLLSLTSVRFWAFVFLVLCGAVVGSIRGIALATCVTLLVPEAERDKANGLVGTANGISFALTSVFSGLVIGQLDMAWALRIAIVLMVVVIVDLLTIRIPEEAPDRERGTTMRAPVIDIRGAVKAITLVPGLFALILFTTFNNLLGGVFMSLMDPYGLELVSVEVWGIMWGALSFGFMLGGVLVATRGLGRSPLRTLFVSNMIMWSATVVFPIRSSIVPLGFGIFVYLSLWPVVEAAEQTIIQKTVPYAMQGRVFGFAQAVESSASPIVAFFIGPIAQLWVIPFMTNGIGMQTIGPWFGVGVERGIALIFIVAGVVGLIVTLIAMRSSAYERLAKRFGGSDA